MSIIAIIAIAAAALVVLAFILVARRPSAFRVARAQRIAAPPAAIMARIADFRAWSTWSPWEDADPASRRDFGGPATGVGATYHWSGNRRVGEGRMAITELVTDRHLGIDIEFIRPFRARNRVEFDLAADAGATTVTWAMSGDGGLMGKVMGLFIDCDAMIGGMYEKGLARLKERCESEVAASAAR